MKKYRGQPGEDQIPWDWRSRRLTVLSIFIVAAWLAFIIFYALFWSTEFTLFQNIIVTIASFLLTGLFVGVVWVLWGMRRVKSIED
ncbi:MAG: hypothetical protein M1503_12500 [Thaumarchaeota archaeon]|nr:hypothetical protein [Nitrososphaerota archaeon]MCL5319060.1 hypothetical protein [Nitrososphaerota archaeon]